MIRHSPTTVSDLLNEITAMNSEIEDTILIGEKVAMIYEATDSYNQLRGLITNDYLLEDELALVTSIGSGWKNEVQGYHRTMEGHAGITDEHHHNLEDLEDQIRDAMREIKQHIEDNGGLLDDDGEDSMV
jgi:hypothetical protein